MLARLRLLVLLAACLLAAASATAQTRFRDHGSAGPGLQAGKTGSDRTRGWFVDGVWTFTGGVDLGLEYAELERGLPTDAGEVVYGDYETTGFTPHLTLQLLRPDEASLLGFDLLAGYTFARFGGDAVNAMEQAADAKMTGHGYTVGGEVYLRLDDVKNLVAYPSLGLAYTRSTVSLDDVDETSSDHFTVARLSLVLYRHFVVDPQLMMMDDETHWSIAFGVLYP
jgi:hypothetical protein